MLHKKNMILFVAVIVAIIYVIPVWAQGSGKININTATVKELSQLKRIGPAHAQKIVDYREKNGPFQNPQDITKVRGVGEKTWNQNKDRITVGPSNANQTQMGMKSF